jgi:ferredoxin--NADP+ reductase
MFATGTGFAPFASLLRDPRPGRSTTRSSITHTCREVAELTYGREIVDALEQDELIGEMVAGKLAYYPTTTREESPRMGRITTLIESGAVFADLGIPPLDPAVDRAMVCGSLAFNLDIKALLEQAGLREGANSDPAEFVIEKAFVGDGV